MKTCAIIGFGALGKTIFNNLLQVEKIIRDDFKITAICNDDISTISKYYGVLTVYEQWQNNFLYYSQKRIAS